MGHADLGQLIQICKSSSIDIALKASRLTESLLLRYCDGKLLSELFMLHDTPHLATGLFLSLAPGCGTHC